MGGTRVGLHIDRYGVCVHECVYRIAGRSWLWSLLNGRNSCILAYGQVLCVYIYVCMYMNVYGIAARK